MIITEENRPKCNKCNKPAITMLGRLFLCGDCIGNYMKKLEDQREKAILEG